VTGDGKADAIVVNYSDDGQDWNDRVVVRRSTGSSFSPNEDWTGNGYAGNRGTFFADVTGDAKADAIVVNSSGGVTVRRSTGGSFSGNETWTTFPFVGNRGNAFVDVNGDGKADAISVE
jgi:hypothetical protein